MRANPIGQWQMISKCLERSHDPTVRHRLAALGAIACGNSMNEVSRWFDVTRQTLHNWMARWGKSGFCPESLADAPRPGRPPQWAAKLNGYIEEILHHSPRNFGYSSCNWTVGLLREHLASRFGQSLSKDTVRRCLHRLDFVWKRPRYVLEPDPEREKKSLFAQTAAFIA